MDPTPFWNGGYWDSAGWTEPEVYRVTPPAPNQARVADVVFVHGLHGHYFRTWCLDHEEQYWPRWIEEQLDSVRVLSVGYYTNAWPGDDVPTFEHIARGVRNALANADVGTVPTIYICHSLGGLILKRVLELDADEPGHGIWETATGIFFFSTPHGGSSLANFLKIGRNRLIERLIDERGEGILDELQDRFGAKLKLRESLDLPPLQVFNYYETKNYGRVRIVKVESARRGFDSGSSEPVPAHHVLMVKFHKKQNGTYLHLVRLMKQWLVDAEQASVANDEVIESIPRTGALPLPAVSLRYVRSALYLLLGAAITVILLFLVGIWTNPLS